MKLHFPESYLRIDLGTLFEQRVGKYGDKHFLTYVDDDEHYTYNEFNMIINRVAHGLKALRLSKGNYVVTMMPNCSEAMIVSFALHKLGVIDVAVNRHFRGDGLARMINLTKARFLITNKKYVQALEDIRSDLKYLKNIIFDKKIEINRKNFHLLNISALPEILSDNSDNPTRVVTDDTEIAAVLFTSGTTGVSKGCKVSHRYCVRSADSVAQFLDLNENDCVYTPYPLFHITARLYDILPAVMVGGSVVLRSKFSLSKFWPEIVKHKATYFLCQGSVQTLLYNREPCKEEKLHKLRITWAGPMVIDRQSWEKRFGVELMNSGYGSTETGSVAVPIRGHNGAIVREIYDVRVFDKNDDELPKGEIGQMVIRPLEPSIMFNGYFGMPEQTLNTMQNLWFHSGDLGLFDQDGYFYFVGRMTEKIRVRGEMVSAFEVEEIFLKHSSIADCGAIGVPCTLGEENVKLYVELKPGVSATEEELIEYGKKNLSKYMAPKEIEFMDELPRNISGKVQKHVLEKMHSVCTSSE